MEVSANIDEGREKLAQVLARHAGASASIENIVVPTLGGSNRTIIFDLVEGTSRRRMVSRQATYAGDDNPFLPAAAQFAVMRLAHAHGFPVPEPILLFEPADGLGEGFVTAFVAGETMPSRIVAGRQFEALRPRLAAQVGALLALLHGIDPAQTPQLATTRDSLDPLAAQVGRYDLYDEPHPAIELGLRWLERNRPDAGPHALLHGDFRTGNLMVGPAGITAVLDWECSHLGSPAEDLGWLSTRSWRFSRPDLVVGGFGHLSDLLASYADHGGRRITPDEVRYWQVFGLVRWAILNMMQAHGHVFGGRRDVIFAACGRNTSLIEYDLLMTLRNAYA
ncbi:phosphotransferase family protein [Chelatococcus reniformis]|uniref:Tyrosine protein kinase:aminoglycoside phosphotransferase n=1 Tax=Chelatococcus reniformis TaxID=1494448 RepID=A0A916X8V8_9HYPH|nr:phosphotransferase family protein [Chelatococcus reniformis]GGC52898.1 tyrosine protein kinase:aminoglycoside phosphotransferase [Chelatococcus reniformis]